MRRANVHRLVAQRPTDPADSVPCTSDDGLTVQLDPDTADAVGAYAEEHDLSEAEAVPYAVDDHLRRPTRPVATYSDGQTALPAVSTTTLIGQRRQS